MVAERLFDVRGARVVVTGAASGLGFAMAEVLSEAGARVTSAAPPGTRTCDCPTGSSGAPTTWS
jgi:NAD(P)-dependent dehydrogenase (short-subunit alcohol dehydrogenase family)